MILVWQLGWGGVPYLLNALLGGFIAGALLLIPFFVRAAGAGDLKYLFAGGLLVGFPAVFPMLLLTSVFGLVLGIVMQITGRVDAARLKHFFRCVCDWRYDRAEGRKNLPDRESETVRIPFGIAISAGTILFSRPLAPASESKRSLLRTVPLRPISRKACRKFSIPK